MSGITSLDKIKKQQAAFGNRAAFGGGGTRGASDRGYQGGGRNAQGSVSGTAPGAAPGPSGNEGNGNNNVVNVQAAIKKAKEIEKIKEAEKAGFFAKRGVPNYQKGPNVFQKGYGYIRSAPEKYRRLSIKDLIDKKRRDKQLSFSAPLNFFNSLKPSRVDSEYSYNTPITKDMMGVNEIDYMDFGNYGLTGKNMTDIDRMNRALDKDSMTQTEFEAAYFGPKGKPIFDNNSGDGDPYILPINYNTGAAEVEDEYTNDFTYRMGDNQNVIYDDYGKDGYRTTAAEGGIMGTRARRAMGGIMNRVDQRQGYFLGKIVKGIGKAVSGVAKAAGKVLSSDAGKLALLAGGIYGYNAMGGMSGISKFAKGIPGSKFLMGGGKYASDAFNPFKVAGLFATAAPFLGIGTKAKPNEDIGMAERGGRLLDSKGNEALPAGLRAEVQEAYASGDSEKIKDIQKYYSFLPSPDLVNLPGTEMFAPYTNYGSQGYRTTVATGGRIGKAEGGLMDLGGMEKDYRAEGGFVPIGEYEKKDDVPARLSVNEFVFTADAVRGAGQGDIDKGAEIMENMMENLENGGTVSEESQGNKGAQNMFKTSERLGAVI